MEGNWRCGCETCLDTRPAQSLRLPSIDPFLLRQLCRDKNNLNQIARKINGGQWSGADRVQVVAADGRDAELERHGMPCWKRGGRR